MSYVKLPADLVKAACDKTGDDPEEVALHSDDTTSVKSRISRLALIAMAASRGEGYVFVSADDFVLIAKHYLSFEKTDPVQVPAVVA